MKKAMVFIVCIFVCIFVCYMEGANMFQPSDGKGLAWSISILISALTANLVNFSEKGD